jgi:hypothetical protein
MKPFLFRTSLLAAFLPVATLLVACSNRSPAPAPSSSERSAAGEDTDTSAYALRLGRTSHINKAAYTVTCTDGFTQSGTIDVSKMHELEGSIPNLPAGATCSVTLTASSTNGNVQCSGGASNFVVSCPNDEQNFKIMCSRNHVGREWGDDDWRENARTFELGVALNLVCGNTCIPSNTCGTNPNRCGTLPDGCGGTVSCGTCPGNTPCELDSSGTAGYCSLVCTPFTFAQICGGPNACGIGPDGCGGTVTCGTCAVGTRCVIPDGGTSGTCEPSGCVPYTAIAACGNNVCGSVPDGCGGTVSCGTCPSGTCVIPDGGTAGTCANCTPLCNGKQCGPDGCGGTCGTCPSGQGCSFPSQTCAACGVCQNGQNCGQAEDLCFNLIFCGTCSAGQVCDNAAKPAQCCTQQPTSVTCAGKNCGGVWDNCGIQVSCGTCSAGTTCSNPGGGVCVGDAGAGDAGCTPRTTCPPGVTCGSVPDGCGGTVACGACNAGQVCNAGGCCTPVAAATACGTRACGAVSDGCGGEIQCGSCPAGMACGAGGTCVPGCDASSTTLACLATQDKSTSPPGTQCSSCVQNNGCLDPAQQGGTCEMVTGNANPFSGILPDGKTCSQVLGGSSVSETSVCFETLRGIFGSGCESMFQATPCLCGTTDVNACLNGTTTPNGPIYDIYACDFNGTSGATINTITSDFTVEGFGAGMANAIVQCASAFSCDCF